MLTAEPDRYLTDERHLLMLLKKCTLEAALIELAAEEFAALTEDFQTMDLEAIRIASWREQKMEHC